MRARNSRETWCLSCLPKQDSRSGGEWVTACLSEKCHLFIWILEGKLCCVHVNQSIFSHDVKPPQKTPVHLCYMCDSSDGAGKRGSLEVNREARCQKSAFQQASSSSGWELNPFFSLITFMPAFSFYLHCLAEAIGFRIWVKFSVSLLLWSLLRKRTGEGTERDSWSFEELRKRGGGWGIGSRWRIPASASELHLFFVMTASSICCLLLLLTSLISFFHHQPSPFTYWAVLPLICPSTGALIHPPSVGQWQTFNWWESRSN